MQGRRVVARRRYRVTGTLYPSSGKTPHRCFAAQVRGCPPRRQTPHSQLPRAAADCSTGFDLDHCTLLSDRADHRNQCNRTATRMSHSACPASRTLRLLGSTQESSSTYTAAPPHGPSPIAIRCVIRRAVPPHPKFLVFLSPLTKRSFPPCQAAPAGPGAGLC